MKSQRDINLQKSKTMQRPLNPKQTEKLDKMAKSLQETLKELDGDLPRLNEPQIDTIVRCARQIAMGLMHYPPENPREGIEITLERDMDFQLAAFTRNRERIATQTIYDEGLHDSREIKLQRPGEITDLVCRAIEEVLE